MSVEWRIRDLVKSLRPVAQEIGVDGARRVVTEYGGMRLHISPTWHDGHILAALGEDAARKLIARFAGEVLTIPKSLVTAEARIAKAAELRQAGYTVNAIARALDLSHRGAQEHLAGTQRRAGPRGRQPKDPRQIDIDDLLGARRA